MIEQILNYVASLAGLSPSATLAAVGVIVAIANIVGKSIPDTATGPLGIVRRIAKVIGLYVPNNSAPAR